MQQEVEKMKGTIEQSIQMIRLKS